MSIVNYTTLNNLSSNRGALYPVPDVTNYIHLYHVNKHIVLPTYGEANNDSISISYNPSTPLLRTAPIQSYANSGPRTLLISLRLHRDLMNELNTGNTGMENYLKLANKNTGKEDNYNDYVDLLAKWIPAAALPTYELSSKMVNPPLVALKLGTEIFIKGVVSGSVGVSYGLPILANERYAMVEILFGITEVIPYDAVTVMEQGSYRGIATDLSRGNLYVVGGLNLLDSVYSFGPNTLVT